jgi:hypothetical protein
LLTRWPILRLTLATLATPALAPEPSPGLHTAKGTALGRVVDVTRTRARLTVGAASLLVVLATVTSAGAGDAMAGPAQAASAPDCGKRLSR